jgi:hypothetical protein
MMRRHALVLILAAAISLFAGCAALEIDPAIKRYNTNFDRVRLGMTEADVREVLGNPGSSPHVWAAERNKIEGVDTTVLYYRVARYPDGLTTKAELSPLLFVNDKLEAVGWAAMDVRVKQLSAPAQTRHSPRPQPPSFEKIPLAKVGGLYTLPVTINGVLASSQLSGLPAFRKPAVARPPPQQTPETPS